jgi:hypothetical protein
MSIFKKLFSGTEPSEEQKLLESLQRLSDALCPVDTHWAGVLATFRAKTATEFANDAPASRRYQIAREIEGVFGGIGTLNDISLSGECERFRSELFAAVQGVLRVYWRALGRQSHVGQVAPLPVSSAVHLVPGRIRYFERDESPVVIEDTPAVREQTWRVVRHDGPDISNMASYLVQHNDTFMNARHESLAPVRACVTNMMQANRSLEPSPITLVRPHSRLTSQVRLGSLR